MALVNVYIIWNLIRQRKKKPKEDHLSFFKTLQAQLVATTLDDFTVATKEGGTRVYVPPRSAATLRAMSHVMVESTDTRNTQADGAVRKRFRQCKVCTILKVSECEDELVTKED